MSTIISSPGVQINEIDLTSNVRQTNGLTVAVVGYANEGPVYEPTYISSTTELDNIFGTPTNAAERYMYHSARQVLSRSLAQVLAVRLPYDNSNAVDTRNVLVYPVSASNMEKIWGTNSTAEYETVSELLDEATQYIVLPPVSMLLTQDQYDQEVLQKAFDWERTIEIPKYGPSASAGGPRVKVAPVAAALVAVDIPLATYTLHTTASTSSGISVVNGDLEIVAIAGSTSRTTATGVTFAATTSAVDLTDVAGLRSGLIATHANLPADTKILTIVGNTVTFDKAITANILNQTINFSHGVAVDEYVSFDTLAPSTGAALPSTHRLNDPSITFRVKAANASRFVVSLISETTTFNELKSTATAGPITGTLNIVDKGAARMVLPRYPVAMIVADTTQGVQTNLFEGVYVGFTDNSSITNDTTHNSLSGIKALNGVKDSDDGYVGIQSGLPITGLTNPILRNTAFDQPPAAWAGDPIGDLWVNTTDNYDYYTSWQDVPKSRIEFKMTSQTSTAANNFINVANSISEVVEKIPFDYSVYTDDYNDSLIMSVFRLKKSIYSLSTDVLTYSYNEGHIGSLYSRRQQSVSTGGAPQSFFIEDVVSANSRDFILQVTPYISQSAKWIKPDSDTTSTGIVPEKTVRIHSDAKNLYAIGTYQVNDAAAKKLIGNLPEKLDKALKLIEDPLVYPIDLIVDAGLSTVWPTVKYKFKAEFETDLDTFKKKAFFSDEDGFPQELTQVLGTKNIDYTIEPDIQAIVEDFQGIQQYFTSFAGDNRKDLVYISDPLRQLFVKGKDFKTESATSFNFTRDIFWPLYHIYDPIKSSFVATYASWMKINDPSSAKNIWIPSSGVIAGLTMLSDQNFYPWSAVAGFNRGTINGVVDVALTPSQRNRDLLYKISMNPIANFINDGIVVFGQKTMFTKPSAFDRLNVRRLFITLEKFTARAVKYFVFEPNSFVTRNRLVATLQPVFEEAKQTDGLFDYRIVCDERNNTPDVIDNNELKVDIYIKPTRTAEFILVNFYATRTSQNFDEIVPL